MGSAETLYHIGAAMFPSYTGLNGAEWSLVKDGCIIPVKLIVGGHLVSRNRHFSSLTTTVYIHFESIYCIFWMVSLFNQSSSCHPN